MTKLSSKSTLIADLYKTWNWTPVANYPLCDEPLMVADSEKWSLGPFPLYMCGRRLLAGGHDMSGHYTRSSKIGSSLTSRVDLSTETCAGSSQTQSRFCGGVQDLASDVVGVSHLNTPLSTAGHPHKSDAIFRTTPQNLMSHNLSPFKSCEWPSMMLKCIARWPVWWSLVSDQWSVSMFLLIFAKWEIPPVQWTCVHFSAKPNNWEASSTMQRFQLHGFLARARDGSLMQWRFTGGFCFCSLVAK